MKEQLTGRLKELFGISYKLKSKLNYHLHELHKSIIAKDGKLQISDEIHRIALRLFHYDYFPIISRNIKIDDHNTTIIMGGIAFNMNIPDKMKYLRLDTDDIDIKVFTTGISYLEQNKYAISKVLSVFKFTILIICMYLKQFFNILNKFTPYTTTNKTNKTNELLSNYELILQLKVKEKDLKTYRITNTIDITKLSYSQLYDKIMDNVSDYSMLITNKIVYKTPNSNKLRTITFSDSNVVFASLNSPAFFAQYLESTHQSLNKPIETLIKMKIPVSKIMDMKTCSNNCKFMSIKSLIMDNVIMMSYADLLAYEQLEDSGQILVPAGFIFKYYKYLVKYIRLITLRKFYANTLDKEFQYGARALWQYALNDIRTKAASLRFGLDERDPIVITYKNYLNEFHQNLFHNKSFLSTNFPVLMEIADEYQRIVFFVNKSRDLFSELNDSSKPKTISIENIVIKFAQQELSKYSESGSYSRSHFSKHSDPISGGSNSKSVDDKKSTVSKPIILSLEAGETGEDIDDGDDLGDKTNIIKKIDKLLKDEVNFYSSISMKNLSKKSFNLSSHPSTTKTSRIPNKSNKRKITNNTSKTMKTMKTKKLTK